jgi:hypothetical protein
LQRHLRFEEQQLSALRASALARHLLLVDDDKYEAWSRNKEALFYPLITYVTKVWGCCDNVAKLQVPRVCTSSCFIRSSHHLRHPRVGVL